MMYDELVKKLRNYASFTAISPFSVDLSEAADAIEELENKLNLWRQDKISRWIPVTEEQDGKV